MPEEQERAGLTKEQKTGAVLLSIFTIFAIVLGVLQIRNTMYAPFALNKKIPQFLKHDISGSESLVYRDTDKDGLNDFDELYVYGTSPYLADTDSDEIPDKTEVEKGTNPVCPEGKDCALFGADASALPAYAPATSSLEQDQTDFTLADLEKATTDPTQIRRMLLESGVDKKVLDATTDAELIKMIKDLMVATGTASGQ